MRKSCNKLINEVRNENAVLIQKRIDETAKRSVVEDLVLLERESNEIVRMLWTMVNSGEGQERMRALQTIFSIRKGLFDLKFNAGIFKLGHVGEANISIPDLVRIVKSAGGSEQSL